MNRPTPPGYMTADELRAGVHADIRDNAEALRARLARKNAFRQYEISSQYHNA